LELLDGLLSDKSDNWVLIPCHNNSALLMAGLESILAQSIPVRIMAINNGSKDNVPFVLNNLGNEHITVNAYPQLGVSGAWNFGLRYLFDKEGAEKVLVVNQDVVLLPETYEVLNGEPGEFVSAVSVQHMDQLRYQRGTNHNRRPHPDFSCFRITRSCYRTVGPFDEEAFPIAWYEDNDFHIRAAQRGIELVCIDLPFYHYAAGTMKAATEYEAANYYGPAFLKSKQRFKDKWGVVPGASELDTKAYEEMCSPTYWASNN